MIKMARKWICRCLGSCGKIEIKRKPKRGLCPHCGEHCAPAILASDAQAAELAGTTWRVVAPTEVVPEIERLGLIATIPGADFSADLSKVSRLRNDVRNSKHLIAHRHIMGRSGFANGDLKTRSALTRAMSRGEGTSPFFPKPSLSNSPSVMGKFVEAEFGFRASRRVLKTLSLVSEQLVYEHPVLDIPINVEIDGSSENLPVELKTVTSLDLISGKLRGIIMQLAGQAIAKGEDSGVLIVAEREGNRLTAVVISGLAEYHINKVEAWISESTQSGVLA
jgi:hypothetical protein